VQLKNEISNPEDLFEALTYFYKIKNREMRYLSSGYVGQGGSEGDCFYVSFLLDRQYVLRYSMPNARRTFPVIYLGIGPEYVPIEWLVQKDAEFKLSWEMTSQAVGKNLILLDDFLTAKKNSDVY
jgi:hypothetical protein